jgi:hypothetical protein
MNEKYYKKFYKILKNKNLNGKLTKKDKKNRKFYLKKIRKQQKIRENLAYWKGYNQAMVDISTTNSDTTKVEYLTKNEGKALFDNACQTKLGISGEEFIAKYGDRTIDCSDNKIVAELKILQPFWGK